MTLGQRVAVLRDGLLQQFDTPQNLFHHPGEPLRGGVHRLAVDEPRRRAGRRAAGSRSRASASTCRRRRRPQACEGRVVLGVRPTDFEHGATAEAELPRVRVKAGRRRGSRLREPRDLHDRRAARHGRGRARGDRAQRGRRQALRRRPGDLHRLRRRAAPGGERRRGRSSRSTTAGCTSSTRPPAGRSRRLARRSVKYGA